MGEIIFVITLAGGMFGPAIFIGVSSGYWHFFFTILAFFMCFGLLEWHAVATTGMSISQQIWDWGEQTSAIKFWITIGILAMSWMSLMWHFASKKIKKRGE